MARDVKSAIDEAVNSVDEANASAKQCLDALNDDNRKSAIIAEVQREVSETPGWLDEIGKMIDHSRISRESEKK